MITIINMANIFTLKKTKIKYIQESIRLNIQVHMPQILFS